MGASPRCQQGEVRIRSCGCAVGTRGAATVPSLLAVVTAGDASGSTAAHLNAWLQCLQVGKELPPPSMLPSLCFSRWRCCCAAPMDATAGCCHAAVQEGQDPHPTMILQARRSFGHLQDDGSIVFARAKRDGVILAAKFQNIELISVPSSTPWLFAQRSFPLRSGNVDCTNTHCTQRCEAQ